MRKVKEGKKEKEKNENMGKWKDLQEKEKEENTVLIESAQQMMDEHKDEENVITSNGSFHYVVEFIEEAIRAAEGEDGDA